MVILELARQGDLEKMSSNVEQIVKVSKKYSTSVLLKKYKASESKIYCGEALRLCYSKVVFWCP